MKHTERGCGLSRCRPPPTFSGDVPVRHAAYDCLRLRVAGGDRFLSGNDCRPPVAKAPCANAVESVDCGSLQGLAPFRRMTACHWCQAAILHSENGSRFTGSNRILLGEDREFSRVRSVRADPRAWKPSRPVKPYIRVSPHADSK